VGNQPVVGFLGGATRSIGDLAGRALQDYCRQTAGGQPANGGILTRSYEEHQGSGWQGPKRLLSADQLVGSQPMVGFLRGATRSIGDLAGR